MNYLVVYYSRTGLTRKVGESISDLLHCDRDEIRKKTLQVIPQYAMRG